MQTSQIASSLTLFAERCWQRLADILLSPTSNFSALSLLSAFLIAAAFLTLPRARRVRASVLVRALLPRRWLKSASGRADLGLMALNVFAAGALVGWAILSTSWVERQVGLCLDFAFGPGPLFVVPPAVMAAIVTVAFYLAYELAYFVYHRLSHEVPLLWHFHRVHHTAETLSPVTNYRVHPVDSVLFYNAVALCIGATLALVRHLFGTATDIVGGLGANAILLSATYLLTHLQHSHLWIAFTGWWGRIVLSPAHHQLHHSADPKHFNSNFGNTLALFDWWAGTLRVPTRKRERLAFGAGPTLYDPHSISGLLVMPFMDAIRPAAGSSVRFPSRSGSA